MNFIVIHDRDWQPRPQGFSLFWGKSPGDEVAWLIEDEDADDDDDDNRDLTIRQRRRPWKRRWKTDLASF